MAEDTLVIRTKPGMTVEVKLVGTTRYMKWIIRKPWQQSTRADPVAMEAGANRDRRSGC